MASAAGAALTEQHRLAQLRLGALTALQVHQTWPLLDLQALDATFGRWLTAVNAIVGVQHRISAQLAAGYYTTFRRLELGPKPKPIVPIVVAAPVAGAVATSMLVTGPISIKAAMGRGVQLARASETAAARAAGAAMRNVLAGGRDTITQTAQADSRAHGWARVASGRACDFCAGLEGQIFSADTVDFAAHDHCSCSGEPAF